MQLKPTQRERKDALITVRLPSGLKERFRRLCERAGTTESAGVEQLIQQYCETNEGGGENGL